MSENDNKKVDPEYDIPIIMEIIEDQSEKIEKLEDKLNRL